MADKTIWAVRAFGATGETKVTRKNGITTHTPCTGWFDLKIFDNPGEADNWLCYYVRKNGYSITDFTVSRREA